MRKVLKKLADEGNFVAQDSLAKSYEAYQNHEMAVHWYTKAIKNPKTPRMYKELVYDDLEKLEEKFKGTENKEEKPLSESTKKQLNNLKEDKEKMNKLKRKAILLEDEETLKRLKELEETVDSQTKCFEEKEEHNINICLLEQIKNLADKGNYFAQHMLGNLYENAYENKPMAIQWYKKALENSNTPENYLYQLQNDLDRVQGKEKKEE
jgi:TPR repeat protein